VANTRPVPFGNYFLLERIAVGGMAEIYKAKRVGVEGFEKTLAIKRILPAIAAEKDFISMFIDEAKISVQLTHANIAQTYELGRAGDTYFIALEYVPGRDLRAVAERMRRRGESVAPELAAFVVSRVAEGLDYAHRRKDGGGRELGIIHRDVSPQNILVSWDGEVKLVDFGIAKAANKIMKTQAGILKGKFGYMSPEQVRGLPLDRRSDVFAAGIVLYEILAGERLFVGESDYSVLEKVRNANVPALASRRQVPAPLDQIVARALAREPEDRYQWAGEMAADLQRFLLSRERLWTRDDLSAWMRATFAEEFEREKDDQAEPSAPEETPAPLEPDAVSEPTIRPAALRVEGRRPEGGPVTSDTPLRTLPPPPVADLPAPEPPPDDEDEEDTTTEDGSPSSSVLRAPPPRTGDGTRRDTPRRAARMADALAAEDTVRRDTPRAARLPPPVPLEEEPTAPRDETPRSFRMARALASEETARVDRRPRTPFVVEDEPTVPRDETPRSFRMADALASEETVRRDTPRSVRMADAAASAETDRISVETDADDADSTRTEPDPVLLHRSEALRAEIPPPRLSAPRASRPGAAPSRTPAWVRPAARASQRPSSRAPAREDEDDDSTPAYMGPSMLLRPEDEPTALRPAPASPLAAAAVFAADADAEDPTHVSKQRGAYQPRRRRIAALPIVMLLSIVGAVGAWYYLARVRPKMHPAGASGAGRTASYYGTLTVNTEPPDAQVFLDQKLVKAAGPRPFTTERLDSTVTHVVVVSKDGFRDAATTVSVARGDSKEITVKLHSANPVVTVTSTPTGAAIYVDGTERGRTPTGLATVMPGTHALRAELRCFQPVERTIDVGEADQLIELVLLPQAGACAAPRPSQTRDQGFLRLSSRPPARVTVDGQDTGQTTPVINLGLAPGRHKVRLDAGPRSDEFEVVIRAGKVSVVIRQIR